MAELLNGHRALVFVGGDGLGEAVVARLRQEGAQVFAAGPGGDTPYHSKPAEVSAVFDRAVAKLGGLDDVVNTVTHWWVGNPEDADAAVWDELSTGNSAAGVAIAQESARRITGKGSLCSLGCLWSAATSPELGLTGASKAVLAPLTKSLALGGAKRGFRANLVSVGLIDTPHMRHISEQRAKVAGADDAAGAFDRETGRVALRRGGKPDEVGKVVAFLASDHARTMTGATVLVDGGLLWT
ncbi:MAG: SDR family oxidoreductase [Gammaproteobacteria bacterium]|nr:SDR family oxidoreductase [Gammaproteobacteria bacterium]